MQVIPEDGTGSQKIVSFAEVAEESYVPKTDTSRSSERLLNRPRDSNGRLSTSKGKSPDASLEPARQNKSWRRSTLDSRASQWSTRASGRSTTGSGRATTASGRSTRASERLLSLSAYDKWSPSRLQTMANFDCYPTTEHGRRLERLYLRKEWEPRQAQPPPPPEESLSMRERWALVEPPPRAQSSFKTILTDKSECTSEEGAPQARKDSNVALTLQDKQFTVQLPSSLDLPWSNYNLAKQVNLSMQDLHYCQQIFAAVDVNNSGRIERDEFRDLIVHLQLYEAGVAKKDLADSVEAWWFGKSREDHGPVDFPEFVAWFASHSFDGEFWLSPEKLFTRVIARELNLPVLDVERFKEKFDRFDNDSSGFIDFDEFSSVLSELLRIPKHMQLPTDRIKYFWRQIDVDGSGTTDFKEFLAWYLKYFSISNGSCPEVSPVAEFYRNVRRPIGRDSIKD